MRILCVSDQVDLVVYSSSIRERFKDVDLVLSAGDLPMDYLSFIVSGLNKPLIFVFGNHNLEELAYYRPRADVRGRTVDSPFPSRDIMESSGAVYAGFRVVREGGLLVAGLGGSRWYNGGANQFTNLQMALRILLLIPALLWNRIFFGRFLDILLTHAPPEGIHDQPDPCHRGFRPFLWFMRTFRPRFLVHGHVHLYDREAARISTYLGTTVVNAFGHVLLDWENRT
ncbi:MAG: metallophosphoesterase [Treponema sp.]|nr:metallophosphoesterase [Treponema sp.]